MASNASPSSSLSQPYASSSTSSTPSTISRRRPSATTLLSLEEHLSLLSLPILEAIFFRSVCLYRPTGPVRHWAVISIAKDLNAAIHGLEKSGEERRAKANPSTGGKKRKRGSEGGSRGRGGEKKFKNEDGSNVHPRQDPQDEEDEEEGESDASGEEGADENDDDDELDEEEEAAELVCKMKCRGTLQVTPEVVWTKLDVFFNTEGLDELEDAAISPSELASPEAIRSRGFSSSLKVRPHGAKVREHDHEADEEDEEEAESQEEADSIPIDFALVPGLQYEPHVATRRIQTGEESLARAGAGLGDSISVKDKKADGARRNVKEEAGDISSELSEGDVDPEDEDVGTAAATDEEGEQEEGARSPGASTSSEDGEEQTEEVDEDEEEDQEEGEEDEDAQDEEEDDEAAEADDDGDNSRETPTRGSKGRAPPSRKGPSASSKGGRAPGRSTTSATGTPKPPRSRGPISSTSKGTPASASASRAAKSTRSNSSAATPARRSSTRKR